VTPKQASQLSKDHTGEFNSQDSRKGPQNSIQEKRTTKMISKQAQWQRKMEEKRQREQEEFDNRDQYPCEDENIGF
jgi:hypothetical protein